jgi:hypothetical protein
MLSIPNLHRLFKYAAGVSNQYQSKRPELYVLYVPTPRVDRYTEYQYRGLSFEAT